MLMISLSGFEIRRVDHDLNVDLSDTLRRAPIEGVLVREGAHRGAMTPHARSRDCAAPAVGPGRR